MTAPLRRHLVLEVDAGDAGALVVLDGADHPDGVPVPGVGVGDHRDLHGRDDPPRVANHLGPVEKAHVGAAEQRGGGPEPGHVDGGEPRRLDETR